MSDDKSPVEQVIEQALDVFVYAPIGLVFEGPALLPKLIEKGKSQVSMARVLGRFAVDNEGPKIIRRLQKQAEGLVGGLDRRSPAPAATAPAPTPAAAAAAAVAPVAPVPSRSSARAADLAITDYDSLSASQVVNRLAGLSAGELEAVRDYEAEHRGRKTILNKVSQLQG